VIACSEAVKQLWEYLDGIVDESQRAAIDEHLSFCRRCCGELEFAEELRRFLVGGDSDEIPDDVKARLTTALDDLGAQA
jgi:mycothiol system anti-sigma-R factor